MPRESSSKISHICRWIDNLGSMPRKILKSPLYVPGIGEYTRESRKMPLIDLSEESESKSKNRTHESWKWCKVLFSEIIEIPWWCMAIVIRLGIRSDVSECSETISGKYDDVIFAEDACLPEESPLEDKVSPSLRENWIPQCNHLPLKSEFSWIKTPFREKPGNQVSSERFCHECHKSLPSSAIEKRVMKNGNFRDFPLSKGVRGILLCIFFLLLHGKRILNSLGKTIEFGWK